MYNLQRLIGACLEKKSINGSHKVTQLKVNSLQAITGDGNKV